MSNQREIENQRRQKVARDAIINGADHPCINEFATHHIEEVETSYWLKHCGTSKPTVEQVLAILVLRDHWGGDDEDDRTCYDFTLPDDATNYVIAVRFTDAGEINYISMES